MGRRVSVLRSGHQPVAPVNYYLHALFSQVDVWLNDTLVTASENTYATRAYLEALLHYGPDAKRGHLSSALWYADTAGKMTSTTRDNNAFPPRWNSGISERPIPD